MKRVRVCLLVYLCLTFCFVFTVSSVWATTETVWDIEYDIKGTGEQVIKTSDGGYAVAGNSEGQFLLLKLDPSGSVEWNKTFGQGTAFSIIQTVDGGYALAGTGDDTNFVKVSPEGELEWSKNYTNSDVPFHVQEVIQTNDGGYALAGWTSPSFNSPQWDWTIKTSAQGNIQWNKTFGLRSGMSGAQAILEEPDGYILAANSNLSKLDLQGNMEWTKTCVVANGLIKTVDGGYLVAAGNGATLVKMDNQGNTQWSQSYRHQGARWTFFHSVIQSSEGSYVTAGVTYPLSYGLAWIMTVNQTGDIIGETVFAPQTGINNKAYSIIQDTDDAIIFTGTKNAPNGQGNLWLAKISPTTIPEFPTYTILPLLTATTVIVLIWKKRLHKTRAY